MFFVFGISQREKKLNYNSKVYVHACGKYGRMEVFMIYTCLFLFFIPIFKWGKKYFVRYTCCSKIYELNKEIGLGIEKGINVSINETDLVDTNYNMPRYCNFCSYPLANDYEYCPKCGKKI